MPEDSNWKIPTSRRAKTAVDLRIVECKRVEIDRDSVVAPDRLESVLQYGQRSKPEEVHLQQTDPFDGAHVPLRRDVPLARPVERHVLDERGRADHDPRRVGGRMPREPLQDLPRLDQVADLRILLIARLQVGALFEGLLERDVEGRRDHLRDLVDIAVWHPLHTADIPNDGAGGHRSEGDDLGDVLGPVLLDDIADHLARPRSEKSTSMSGMLIRSGFKNRSKIRL